MDALNAYLFTEQGAYLGAGLSILAVLYAFYLNGWIQKQSAGTDRMKELASAVQEGAMAFLRTEYKILSIFVLVVAAILWWALGEAGSQTAIAYLAGALASGIAGWVGMKTATLSAVRTTEAAKNDVTGALKVAFRSGTVMGLTVVGLGLLGVCVLFTVFLKSAAEGSSGFIEPLFGFSFGASTIALFARVGGGIFTKAADVGADLVGKVEAGIPEDDPRNPATIADNVGDNVGDVAGMGADLFESYVGSMIACMTLAIVAFTGGGEFSKSEAMPWIVLPMVLCALGTLASLIGTFMVKTSNKDHVHAALERGLLVASGIFIVLAAGVFYLMGENASVAGKGKWEIFGCLIGGLAVGVIIGKITEHYTSEKAQHAQKIAADSEQGTATNIISGLAIGMQSTVWPVLWICVAIFFAYEFGGLYGISLSAVGMLSTLGISLGIDAFGPVADNAGGIAEMAECDPEVRERTDSLDAVGNTTAAIGKGFAIGSAALTSLALFNAFAQKVPGGVNLNILESKVTIGLFLGAIMTFLFSALTMKAVGRAAGVMIEEVRRQFREIPGILEGKGKPDYKACVDISTKGSLKEMLLPGLLAVVVPVLVGRFLGAEALGGLLAGALVSGVLFAIFMSNAGGAWDNAKKYIETGAHGGKGSEAHKAAVVGDTVGDPFKDTSGPSLNILIKLMTIVSLVCAPLFKSAIG